MLTSLTSIMGWPLRMSRIWLFVRVRLLADIVEPFGSPSTKQIRVPTIGRVDETGGGTGLGLVPPVFAVFNRLLATPCFAVKVGRKLQATIVTQGVTGFVFWESHDSSSLQLSHMLHHDARQDICSIARGYTTILHSALDFTSTQKSWLPERRPAAIVAAMVSSVPRACPSVLLRHSSLLQVPLLVLPQEIVSFKSGDIVYRLEDSESRRGLMSEYGIGEQGTGKRRCIRYSNDRQRQKLVSSSLHRPSQSAVAW